MKPITCNEFIWRSNFDLILANPLVRALRTPGNFKVKLTALRMVISKWYRQLTNVVGLEENPDHGPFKVGPNMKLSFAAVGHHLSRFSDSEVEEGQNFKWIIPFSTNDWLWNVLYPGMKHFAYVIYVGFDAQINLCDKQNVLFNGTRRRNLCKFSCS